MSVAEIISRVCSVEGLTMSQINDEVLDHLLTRAVQKAVLGVRF